MPVALEDGLREEANTAVADTHGRGGKAIDGLAVKEVSLEFLFGDVVGCCVIELSQQASFTDIGFLSPFTLATELEGRKYVLTPSAHEIAPS